MRHIKPIFIALSGTLALGVAAAPATHAEDAPFFSIGGARLVAGKTHNADARLTETVKLTIALGTPVISCTGLGTIGAVMLGSNAGTNGSASHIDVFNGCRLVGNGAKCHLAPSEGSSETSTTITTDPVRSEQVENVVSGHVGSKLLSEFYPASKGAGFLRLNFGGECTVKSTTVSGSTVAESVLDTAAAITSGGNTELGQTPQERTSWLLRFPVTPITQVWLVSGGLGLVRETGITAFNEEAIQEGVALVLLASTKFEPEPGALWSPLP